jgi:hypothetical protein
MKTFRRWRLLGLGGLILGLTTLSGCQTYWGGMTLPSPRYLDHPPTYIAPSPPFPLARELATQQQIAAQPEPGLPAPAPLPQRVPGGPGF